MECNCQYAVELYHFSAETVLDDPVGLVPNSAYFGVEKARRELFTVNTRDGGRHVSYR